MAATALQSIDEVIWPDDLRDDDTVVIYENGNPVCEIESKDDPDDDSWDYERYVDLALEYYNDKHSTGYKAVKVKDGPECLGKHVASPPTLHCGFSAAESDISSAKQFLAELLELDANGEKVVVVSCRIVDGLKTTGCDICDISFDKDDESGWEDYNSGWDEPEPKRYVNMEGVLPVSEYSHVLADGVTLSDKAKLRVRSALRALAYYNKKRHTEYKLVDVLPFCYTCEGFGLLYHGNFIARESGCADNKLFFAELQNRKAGWVVLACRIVRGRTTAGCENCPTHRGKRVIHPTSGFRYGRCSDMQLRPRRR